MWKFVKSIKLFPWLFPTYKIHVTSYREFQSFIYVSPFAAVYGQVFLCSTQFSIVCVVEFIRSKVTRH